MDGIIKYDEFDGTPRVICASCKNWEYMSKGGVIRHSSRCDFGDAQWQKKEAAQVSSARVNPNMKSGDGLTGDELLEATQKGYLSMGDAMNTDF